jgi:hypothetical protein
MEAYVLRHLGVNAALACYPTLFAACAWRRGGGAVTLTPNPLMLSHPHRTGPHECNRFDCRRSARLAPRR